MTSHARGSLVNAIIYGNDTFASIIDATLEHASKAAWAGH